MRKAFEASPETRLASLLNKSLWMLRGLAESFKNTYSVVPKLPKHTSIAVQKNLESQDSVEEHGTQQ